MKNTADVKADIQCKILKNKKMDSNYIQTLLTEKTKGFTSLMEIICQVFERLFGGINDMQAFKVNAVRGQLSKLQSKGIDFSSVESMAESIEKILQALTNAMKMVDEYCAEYKSKEARLYMEGLNEDKLQHILSAKILKFHKQKVDSEKLTPIVYFGGEEDMSIYDIILRMSEDLFNTRCYIHNIFYGLRDGEFPVSAYVNRKVNRQ